VVDHNKDVIKYCNDILKGKILSGKYTKKAIKRFLEDLKRQDDPGFDYVYLPEYGNAVIEFAETLNIPDIKRDDGTKNLILLPWQKFIYHQLYSWRYKSNPEKRRFRFGYTEIARKNGKTTGLLFPLVIWDFIETDSAESYFVSADGEQSKKSYRELLYIIKADPTLKNQIQDTVSAIVLKHSRISFFSAESVGIDSYKNSLSIIDEYHQYRENKIVTAFRYGGRARLNNLTYIITSAGLDISLPCYVEAERCKKILNKIVTDENYFGIIYSLDDNDDWQNPDLYIKANPSLGSILDIEVLKKDLASAQSNSSEVPDFKSKTCGLWTQATVNWISLDKWDASTSQEYIEDELVGLHCCGAFDLSNISDFTAWTLCFKKDDKYIFKHRYFIPEETIYARFKKENINILEWVEKGNVVAIPGGTIDYDVVYDFIKKDIEKYKPRRIHFDSWNSTQMIKSIEQEISTDLCVPFNQSLKMMTTPSKLYEKLIFDRKIIDDSPVQRWMISNTQIKADVNGNYKPLKDDVRKSAKRIDGVITAIMALDAVENTDDMGESSFEEIMSII